MSIFQHFFEALGSLRTNKLRSALTVLGIVIGVAAVISMLAIGAGAQSSITTSIESMGTNLLFVSSGARNIRNSKPLTLSDAEALLDAVNAPSIKRVAPNVQGRATVTYSGESTDTSIVGITPDYFTVRNLNVSEGEKVTEAQLTSRAAVAILGTDVATSLFGRTNNLVGETIRVSGLPFRVIGVLESMGGGGFGSADDQILVPITTAQIRLIRRGTRNQVDSISVQAVDSKSVESAIQEVTLILSERHHTAAGEDDFTIMNQQEILSSAQSVIQVLTLFLGGIGGISLLVGGIGIMNIMYVTVTERTREIGLRKAVGARKVDILIQFLMESSVLSLLGGGIGILIAWGISYVVERIATANSVNIHPLIQLNSVLLATLFSAGVGLFFGIFPARRAASLQPVEALRSE